MRRHKTSNLLQQNPYPAVGSLSLTGSPEIVEVDKSLTDGPDLTCNQDEINLSELARLMDIENLLSMMNFAAEEINASQKLASSIMDLQQKAAQKHQLRQNQLQSAIGEERIARAAPYFHNKMLLAKARKQIALSAAACAKAADRGETAKTQEQLVKRHGLQVAEYKDAQQKALQLLKGASAPPSWLLRRTSPFFEAEHKHRAHLKELKGAEIRCARQIAKAKSRYQCAMRKLEAMSEAEHCAKNSAAACDGDLAAR